MPTPDAATVAEVIAEYTPETENGAFLAAASGITFEDFIDIGPQVLVRTDNTPEPALTGFAIGVVAALRAVQKQYAYDGSIPAVVTPNPDA